MSHDPDTDFTLMLTCLIKSITELPADRQHLAVAYVKDKLRALSEANFDIGELVKNEITNRPEAG